jgi:hypothetical protein
MSSVLVDKGVDGDKFVPPEGLPLPSNLTLPSTNKLHAIIEKTAAFIADRGPQMEIIIRIKQKHNPYFAFLEFDDPLNPYYKHVLTAIRHKIYTPRLTEAPDGENGANTADKQTDSETGVGKTLLPSSLGNSTSSSPVVASVSGSEGESDGDSDGEYELHPLLRASMSKTTATKGESSTSVTTTVNTQSYQPSTSTSDPTTFDYSDFYSYYAQWAEYYNNMAAQQQYPSAVDSASG